MPDVRAPNLRFRNLEGGYSFVSDWRGRRVALIFVQPDCADTARLLRAIAGMQPVPTGDNPAPIVVTFGPETVNRKLVDELGLHCPVLLQDDVEAFTVFQVSHTPASVLIDEYGFLPDGPVTGAAGVLTQLGVMPGPGWSSSSIKRRTVGHWFSQLINPRIEEALQEHDQAGPVIKQPETLPLVSVIMTTADRPGLFEIALECYRRQTYPHRELIVVDNGTTFPADDGAIRALGGRLIRVPPKTPLGAELNCGVRAATGRLCQKWDDDDWYAPAFLETMVAAYLRHNAAVCRPTIAFHIRSIWFDLSRWRMVDLAGQDVSGGTLLFSAETWSEFPFREIKLGEDLWFLVDQVTAGASLAPVEDPDLHIYVRHQSIEGDRGHSWTHLHRGPKVETYLRRIQQRGDPAAVFPAWALAAYSRLPRAHATIQVESHRARP
jgi:hypothetical protein